MPGRFSLRLSRRWTLQAATRHANPSHTCWCQNPFFAEPVFKLELPSHRLRQEAPKAAAVTNGRGAVYALAKFHAGVVVTMPENVAPWQRKRLVVEAFAGELPDFELVPVGATVTDVAIMGRPAAGGFVVLPRSCAPLIPVICDCRDVGSEISFVLVQPGRCSLAFLLQLCQLGGPADFQWSISGSAFFDPYAKAFHFRSADTVVLSRRTPGRRDASSPGVGVQQSLKLARRLDLEGQLLRSALPCHSCVYQSNDGVELPEYEVPRPDPLVQHEEEQPTEDEGSPAFDELEELRVPCLSSSSTAVDGLVPTGRGPRFFPGQDRHCLWHRQQPNLHSSL